MVGTVCPHCQQGSVGPGDEFCPECGKAVTQDAVPPPAAAEAPVAAESGSHGKSIIFHVSRPTGDESIPFPGHEIVAGRTDAPTRVFPEIPLDDPTISRRHLALWVDGDELFGQDLESANGVQLNDVRMVNGKPVRLQNGDRLVIQGRNGSYTIRVEMA